MQGGDNGQQRGGIERQGAQHDQRHGGIDLAEQHGQQRQNLGASTGLAVDAGTEVAHTETDVEKSGDDENAQIAAKNQYRNPAGHEALVHEHQEEGAEQELIGHRVEVLADLGLLLEDSGGQAIETVAESGDDEKAKRRLVVRLQNCDDQKGYKAETQESQQVRSCAQFFQQVVPILVAAAKNLDGT
jgi:hypothetical protein